MTTANRINLNDAVIEIAVNQPDTMTQMTTILKEYIRDRFPGVYTFSIIGHPETLSLILPELIFNGIRYPLWTSDDVKMKNSVLSFTNDDGVEIVVRVVSYINFKIGNLHIEPLKIKNGRLYDYTPIKYSIRDCGEYRNDELFKMEKVVNPTTKEELVAMIQEIIFTHGLEEENVGLFIFGHPAEFAKLFPGAEFTSIQGLSYKFMVTTIEKIRIDCIACDDNAPLRIVILRQN